MSAKTCEIRRLLINTNGRRSIGSIVRTLSQPPLQDLEVSRYNDIPKSEQGQYTLMLDLSHPKGQRVHSFYLG